MIGEFLRYWTTPAPERVRKYGYLKRLIAIEYRERRCRAAWGPHLARIRQYIINAIDLVPRKRTAVILGSGLLLDVPLEDLSERFETVYLVDIFHMPRVRRTVQGFRNVKLLTGDITGIFRAMKDGKGPTLTVPPPPATLPHVKDADLLVSCNVLTQLAGPFNDMFRTTQGFTDPDCDLLSAQVMTNHLTALMNRTVGVSVLITDTARVAMRNGKTAGRKDLMKTVTLPHSSQAKSDEIWEWLIAPAPEEYKKADVLHLMAARTFQHQPPEETAVAQPSVETVEEIPADDGLADATPPA
jgi:hypothetical protein